MSFLTAASDRSSSGSGVSGVSGASFSGASSFFSLSFWTALVLLAIHHLLERRSLRATRLCGHKRLRPQATGTLRGHVSRDISLRKHMSPVRRRLPVTKRVPYPMRGESHSLFRDRGTDPSEGAPGQKAGNPPSIFAPRFASAMCRSGLKPPLTVFIRRNPRLISRFRRSPGRLGPDSSWRSKRRTRSARRSPEALDQGLGSVNDRKTSLNVLQPGIIRLGRLATPGLTGMLELLN